MEGVVTDDELMARGAGGDERAFQVLVERWERPVFAFLSRMLGSREEAQDVGQETFLRMCREAGRYEPRGQFRSWLGLITHQQMLRYRQKEGQAAHGAGGGLHDEILDEFAAEAEGAWIEAFNAHIYASALAIVQSEFHELQWQAFQRLWDRGERAGDIARDFQKDAAWVYQLKHKIVTRLKEVVDRLACDVAVLNR